MFRSNPYWGYRTASRFIRRSRNTLANDGRRGNAGALRVSLDDGRVRQGQSLHGESVDEEMYGALRQADRRASHRADRRLQDVDAVDLAAGGPPDTHAQGAFADLAEETLALFGVDLLGVPEPFEAAPGRQNHGGRHDRARKGPAADLVDPGNHSAELPREIALPAIEAAR